MAFNQCNLQKELSCIQKDLALYSTAVGDTGNLDVKSVRKIAHRFVTLMRYIEGMFSSTTIKDGALKENNSYMHYVQTMLCSELASFSPQWAVWVQNKFSLTFMEVSSACEVPFVTNFVTFDFQNSTNSKDVIFFCIPKKLGIRLKFVVQPCELVKTVAGLLKSFQSTTVQAKKIPEPLSPTIEDCLTPNECDLEVSVHNTCYLPVKSEIIDDEINEANASIQSDSPPISSPGVDDKNINNAVYDGNPLDIESDLSNGNPCGKGNSKKKVKPRSPFNVEIPQMSEKIEVGNDNSIATDCTAKGDFAVIECDSQKGDDSGSKVPPTAKQNRKKKSMSLWENKLNESKRKTRGRCRLCKQMVRKCEVTTHLAKKHNIHENVCCFCTKTFASIEQRSYHISMYHPLRHSKSMDSQPCKECQLFIREKDSFEHMEIEHDKQHECPFCPFKVGDMEYCQVSLVDIRTQCNAHLSSQRKLINHIKWTHRIKFRCHKCLKSFNNASLLSEHKTVLKNESERTVELCEKYEKFKSITPIPVCTLCGKSIRKLKKHMAVVHDVGKEAWFKYKCTLCSAAFGYPADLKKHLAEAHYPENRFKCHKCEKTFATEKRMRIHLVHHDAPSIKCPQCDKTFKTITNAMQHLQGCHYPPKYECLSCTLRFQFRSVARIHLKKQHNTDNFEDNLRIHKIDMTADYEAIKQMSNGKRLSGL